MQTRRWESNEAATLGNATPLNLVINQDENRRSNFHGIRAKGRIKVDEATANNAAKGFVTLMCIDQQDVAIPNIDNSADLEDHQGWIVASEVWRIYGGSTTPAGGYTFFDFDWVIKTSRTCPKGGRLILQVFNDSGIAKNVIVTQMLSAFETTV